MQVAKVELLKDKKDWNGTYVTYFNTGHPVVVFNDWLLNRQTQV